MNVFLPLRKLQTLLICSIFMNISLLALAADPSLLIKDLGEGHCLVRVNTTQKYLLLPVEDASPDVRISMIADNKEVKSFDVRLAINKVDYFVPVDLSDYSGKLVSFKFKMNSNDPVRVNLSPDNTACCREMKLSDTFDTTNREKFRPVYHFSPLYGWMNDPNGMVYKDGEYHLFYQHNPYGSKWGNMNWGHAISKDLINWEHRPDAITPDAFGTIFSGSAVVDHNNTAGFGAGAIIAIYTQNGDRQVQSIAYSTDNGRTFTKYADNPVLVSEARDFRDPKVFWYEGTKRWIMVLAVGQEMQIFSSPNLKNWTFESSFGKGQGAHGNVWECPDLFSVDGSDIMVICPMHLGEQKCSYLVGNMDYKNRVFIPSAKASPSCACARPLSKLSTTGRIFSTISFAPMMYMLDFSFSVLLRKLSNSAMVRFRRSVSSSTFCSDLSFFFFPKKEVFDFSSFLSSEAASSPGVLFSSSGRSSPSGVRFSSS